MSLRRSLAVKRAMDVAIALPAAVVTAPIQLVAAIAIRREMGSPILFRQQRPGLDGQPFEMMKFRTMLHEDPARGLVTDEQRLTKLGQFLRSSSIDELPTLWNIVKGDMSIVGPRPLLMRYLPRYSAEQSRRHEVRPGLTGLAQSSGRNALSWDQKFALDVEYVDTWSILGDLRIIWRTALAVVQREGISAEGEVTMPEFMGNQVGTTATDAEVATTATQLSS